MLKVILLKSENQKLMLRILRYGDFRKHPYGYQFRDDGVTLERGLWNVLHKSDGLLPIRLVIGHPGMKFGILLGSVGITLEEAIAVLKTVEKYNYLNGGGNADANPR